MAQPLNAKPYSEVEINGLNFLALRSVFPSRMSLTEYLAKKYLNADTKPDKNSKKRKRKDGSTSGLVIADDDTLGWEHNGGDADDDRPLTG